MMVQERQNDGWSRVTGAGGGGKRRLGQFHSTGGWNIGTAVKIIWAALRLPTGSRPMIEMT